MMHIDGTGKQGSEFDEDLSLTDEVSVEDIDELSELEDGEVSGDLTEEDDDNAYQDSDEALPDDTEEKVISRNPSKEGGHFDEV